MTTRPITFFIHHQGRGHANRAMAIVRELPPGRRVTILCARPDLFDGFDRPVEIVPLPDMIGAPVPTRALFDQPTPDVLHCVPLGVEATRRTMRTILDHLDDVSPALFVVDVSAEIALLSRIASVPAIKIRMHGDRADPGHLGAYQACVGLLAPFDERIEQEDFPAWGRAKTCYTGGLCTTTDAVPTKAEARAKLGIDPEREVVLVLTGGGGAGTPYAPLTMAARAVPDALWLVIGPVHREGHETDFGNLVEKGWVAGVTDHIAAADVVIASAGDNTVHEIARVGRPYICAPEWRYFAEQTRKADRLAEVGAAVALHRWPGSLAPWRGLLDAAKALDPAALAALYDPAAAARAADYIEGLAVRLWAD
ncbi:glycosyltransferase [Sphingomonas hankookensis]|uniref:Glycosyl transferase n=1 Tax=Sphingomonas hengshuiensis TaxID=1609977 RepID=A0A2W4Z7W9_9SPHN|nr:MAG: glycosyl transferase [Sphingomonas hengshuiensis]